MSSADTRVPDHAIAELFFDRASTRAFSNEPITEAVLFQFFEAARWAPSATNAQPWKFVYAYRDSAAWAGLVKTLNERNQWWAPQAAALVAVLSRRVRDSADGTTTPSNSHAFDAGAAWSNFAHQAHLLGWRTRAIGGFDRAAARAALDVPQDYDIQAFIAVGKTGDKQNLPESLRGLEGRTGRRPVREFVSEGRFGA